MSIAGNNQGSGNLWSKFRTSTKSLSSSLSHLSIKTEADGDTPTSTLVHKALVKYYKNQQPFTGFPGWLGHKEDLPDEQKILRRQTEHLEKQANPSGFSHLRKVTSEYTSSQIQGKPQPLERRRTAGMTFHSIYSKSNENQVENSRSQSQPIPNEPNSAQSRIGRNAASWNMNQQRSEPDNKENMVPPLVSRSSSHLMSERLRRNANRNPF